MDNNKMSTFIKSVKTVISRRSPEILTGIGIAGMITTTVLAVKATPKALRIIEEEKDIALSNNEEFNSVDAVKACWKCYIPAAVTGAASVACLIGASSVNARRNAALATAYKLSETALTEYREKVVETVGERKDRDIRDAISKDKVAKDPVEKREIIITGKGESLCYDSAFGRYFKSDRDKLIRIVNDLNRRMRDEMYISLNEFFYEVGLDEVGAGHDLGWNIDRGYIELDFSSQLTADGTPCLVVGFENPPRYDFR